MCVFYMSSNRKHTSDRSINNNNGDDDDSDNGDCDDIATDTDTEGDDIKCCAFVRVDRTDVGRARVFAPSRNSKEIAAGDDRHEEL